MSSHITEAGGQKIPLKGLAIGNGLTDPLEQYKLEAQSRSCGLLKSMVWFMDGIPYGVPYGVPVKFGIRRICMTYSDSGLK